MHTKKYGIDREYTHLRLEEVTQNKNRQGARIRASANIKKSKIVEKEKVMQHTALSSIQCIPVKRYDKFPKTWKEKSKLKKNYIKISTSKTRLALLPEITHYFSRRDICSLFIGHLKFLACVASG